MVTKQPEVQLIHIPAPNIKVMKVRIKSVTPLLFNQWSEKAITMIEAKQKKEVLKGREVRSPEGEYRASFYRDRDGNIAFPALCIKIAVVNAARNIQGVTMTLLRGAVFMQGDDRGLIPLLVNDKKITLSEKLLPIATEEGVNRLMALDGKNDNIAMCRDMVRLGGMGAPADIRYRGQVSNWAMEFLVRYNEDVITPQQVLHLLQTAGFSCGLGEWRPERNGSHGTFEVDMS